MKPYTVTTIGDLGSAICGCNGAPSSNDPTMRGLEELIQFVNPIGYAVAKLGHTAVRVAAGKGAPPAEPSLINELAKALNVDPIDLVVGISGYSNLGRYWDIAKVLAAVAAVGSVAYLGSRHLKKTGARRKGKR